jgi:C4-dicarboxylate-specific signal transduction histidine kinase
MELHLPPEATAAILLFLPVVFFEPLQRLMRRILRRAAHPEMDLVQRLMAEIQQTARQGNLRELVKFIERRVQEQFELATVTLTLLDSSKTELRPHVSKPGERWDPTPASIADQYFPVRHAHALVAVLRAEPHGAAISGETRAALEFLCEQLPGALDLCRLIEEKLRLERELAERERLAVLGQMAASISHNLKNPLGSIKTILHVQMESPELPASIRDETKMVLEEISRLSGKLNQLLQFSRPAIRGGVVAATCDARTVAEEVYGVLRHEAELRGVALEVDVRTEGARLSASSEAMSEILSNLVINALEATPRGGRVKVTGRSNGDGFLLAVEDDGPGIPEACAKNSTAIFTTKTQGTGSPGHCGEACCGVCGNLDWESPAKDAKGTRFKVTMPMKEEEAMKLGRKKQGKDMKTILIVDDEPAARYGCGERWKGSIG